MFSTLNRQKNKNIRPGPEKQHSYKKRKSSHKKKNRLLTSVRIVLLQFVYVSRSVKTCTCTDELHYSCVIICSCVHTYDICVVLDILSTRVLS